MHLFKPPLDMVGLHPLSLPLEPHISVDHESELVATRGLLISPLLFNHLSHAHERELHVSVTNANLEQEVIGGSPHQNDVVCLS